MKALFDTNILIDHLRGIDEARRELSRYSERAISIISWMEVMAGAPPEVAAATRTFLDSFRRLELDDGIAEEAVALRREYRLKLPDAIIWAAARRHQSLLVTRDSRDFPAGDPSIRIPYSL